MMIAILMKLDRFAADEDEGEVKSKDVIFDGSPQACPTRNL